MFARRQHVVAATLMAFMVAAGLSACGSSSGSSSGGSPAVTGGPTQTQTATVTSAPSLGGGGGDATATGAAVGPSGDLCLLLGPADFTAAGVSGARTPTKNSDAPTDAYCVYGGVSGGTGGIEFDAFIGDPTATYQTVVGETGGVTNAIGDLPGVDAAGVNLNGSGGMAAIVVRKGQLVFDMSFPTNPNAQAQLVALAKLVLQRSSALI